MKIGLALSGGAARGMAHVGVLKVLLEHKVPIHSVAGTSAGAIVGASFAAGMTIDEIIQMTAKLRWSKFGRIAFSRFGVLSSTPMRNYLQQNLPVKDFSEMPLAFACVATDLETGDSVVMKERGDVATAVCASCAIPGIYVPIKMNERYLVDGGISELVPTETVRSLGADFVIAVDVNAEGIKFWGAPQTVVGVFFQSAMLLMQTVAKHQLNSADIIIRPKVGHLRWDQVGRSREFIEAGEAATLEVIDKIKNLIQSAK
ncbi:MAG: patatin-like phospholipase family protein [Acidobacteriota bacterium]|nr:patatin-like phospholipase family protein [Acidobacteriota bacterium]